MTVVTNPRQAGTSPTKSDRAIAAAMHIGTIFAPIVVPLAAYILGQSSPFLRAHARKSLAETLLLQSALVIVGGCSLAYSLWSLYGHYQTDWKEFSIWPILIKAAVGWVLLSILEVVNTIAAIRSALSAYAGRWPKRKLATPDGNTTGTLRA